MPSIRIRTMWALDKLKANKHLEGSVSVMVFIGLWPVEPGTVPTRLQRCIWTLVWFGYFFTVFLGFIAHPMSAFTNWGNLRLTFECFAFSCLAYMHLVKTGCFAVRGTIIKELVDRLHVICRRVPTNVDDEARLEIAVVTQRRTNALVLLSWFTIATVGAALAFFRIPLYYYKREYFASIWLPWDEFEYPTFEITMFLWSLQSLTLVSVIVCIDCFFAAILIQVAGQLELLNHDIRRCREDAVEGVARSRHKDSERLNDLDATETVEGRVRQESDSSFENELDIEMCERLREFVIRHEECVRDTEKIFMPMLLNQLLSNIVPTVAAVVFLTSMATVDDKYVLVATLVTICSVELLVCCAVTELIIQQSEGVRDAVFGCDWLQQSQSFKRTMMIMMNFSNQPLTLKVTAWIPVTRETFRNIVNLTYTYHMAVKTAVRGRLFD